MFVGAGDQRLAQQRFTAAVRACDYKQQLAIARQVMKLTEHGFALSREELEARYPRCKGVMTQLVMAEEGLVGVQTSHGFSLTSKLIHQGAVVRPQRGL